MTWRIFAAYAWLIGLVLTIAGYFWVAAAPEVVTVGLLYMGAWLVISVGAGFSVWALFTIVDHHTRSK